MNHQKDRRLQLLTQRIRSRILTTGESRARKKKVEVGPLLSYDLLDGTQENSQAGLSKKALVLRCPSLEMKIRHQLPRKKPKRRTREGRDIIDLHSSP